MNTDTFQAWCRRYIEELMVQYQTDGEYWTQYEPEERREFDIPVLPDVT